MIIFMMIGVSVFANDNERILPKELATEDLNLYFQLIDDQHGNPYAYISREEFRALIDSQIKALPEGITYHNFSSLLVELNQKLRCGHTVVSMDTQLLKRATEKSEFFPYAISIIDNQIFIDFEDGNLPLGSKLLSINGIPAQQLVENLTALTVTDGLIETKKFREIEQKFGYYYFLKFGPSAQFNVNYDFDGQTLAAVVKGVSGNQMMANNYMRPVYKSHDRYIHFTHLDAVDSLETLVLTLNTFQANPEWFYEKIAAQYDKASKNFRFNSLVLDMRNNEGGDRRLLNILYKIIAGKELIDPSSTYTRSLKISHENQLLGINGAANNPEVRKNAENYLEKNFVANNDGKFVHPEHNWHEDFDLGFDLEDIRFEGKVYVLTSGKTFSAAADLARILSQMDNVILVGEETGGAHEARTANMLLNYGLPNSGLVIQIPVIFESFTNHAKNNGFGRGTFPDFYVKKTLTDLINKKDAVFEFTLDLITQSNSLVSN
ncbi:MAG: hypothetical protein ACJAS3_000590 [Roseivirga sp.]|jgi:hypothetical protein